MKTDVQLQLYNHSISALGSHHSFLTDFLFTALSHSVCRVGYSLASACLWLTRPNLLRICPRWCCRKQGKTQADMWHSLWSFPPHIPNWWKCSRSFLVNQHSSCHTNFLLSAHIVNGTLVFDWATETRICVKSES